MKAYRKFGTAKRANVTNGPILKAGDFYIVLEPADDKTHSLIEFAVLRDGTYTGHVNVGHLERLGNANHATR